MNQGRLGRFGRLAVALATAVTGVLTVSTTPANAVGPVVISLTFDDGLSSQYQLAPMLASRGVRATFYLNTGMIPANPAGRMTWTNARALADAGHEIGGHTLTHADLTTLSAAEARRQVCNDRASLWSRGFRAATFAYPQGRTNAQVADIVRQCGYLNARLAGKLVPTGANTSLIVDTVPPVEGNYGIRILGTSEDGPVTLQFLQDSALAAYEKNELNGNAWLPMLFHRVCYAANADYATCMGTYRPVDAAVLDQFIAWAQAHGGFSFKTISEQLHGTANPPTSAPPADAEPVPDPTPVAKAPDIRSLSRYTVPRGRVTTVEVRGANFRRATRVRITGTGIRIRSLTYIGPRKIRVAVKVARSAPRTARTVIVVDRVTLKRDKLPRSLKVR